MKPEYGTEEGSGENDKNAQMDAIESQAGKFSLFGKQAMRISGLGNFGLSKKPGENVLLAAKNLRRMAGGKKFPLQGMGFPLILIEASLRLGKEFP